MKFLLPLLTLFALTLPVSAGDRFLRKTGEAPVRTGRASPGESAVAPVQVVTPITAEGGNAGRLTWHGSSNEPGVTGLFRGDDQVGKLEADGTFRLRVGPGDYTEPCSPPIPLPTRAVQGTVQTTFGQPQPAWYSSPQGGSAGGCSGGSCGAPPTAGFGRRGR